MRSAIVLVIIVLGYMNLKAQPKKEDIPGTYYLKNVRETGAGFRFLENGQFEFFFSYGALDRQGSGNWVLEGDNLILNSAEGVSDFLPGPSSKNSDSLVLIRITGGNNSINPFFTARIHTGDKIQKATARGTGELYFHPARVDRISIQFEFCPEKEYTFTPEHPDHNIFSFTVQPTLFDVVFRKWKMKWDSGTIKGSLPFSNGTEIIFSK